MNYAAIIKNDVANGVGLRVSLFVSGCTHHCKGCFNPETWNFQYGEPFTKAIEDKLISLSEPDYIRGLSLLGGDPLEPTNMEALLPFIFRFKATYPSKDIWCYTGYLFDKDLLSGKLSHMQMTQDFLSNIDVLVDGKFVLELKNTNLQYCGSSNQRIINVKESLACRSVVLLELDKMN